MIKNKYYFVFSIIIIAVIGSSIFYWYEWRPSEIYKKCHNEVYSKELDLSAFGKSAVEDQRQELKNNYNFCLHREGLR